MNIKFFKYTHKIVVTDILVHDVTISHCTDHNIHVTTAFYTATHYVQLPHILSSFITFNRFSIILL